MGGIMVLFGGIGMVVLSVILLIVSVAYRKTAGRKIRDELMREYE